MSPISHAVPFSFSCEKPAETTTTNADVRGGISHFFFCACTWVFLSLFLGARERGGCPLGAWEMSGGRGGGEVPLVKGQ